MNHNYYIATFSLPDGKHIAVANAHPSVAKDHIRRVIMQNPDAVLDDNDIVLMKSPEHLQQAQDALKAENPGRPLAGELGLDSPNRILTDPQIARDLAAQQNDTIAGGAGCC